MVRSSNLRAGTLGQGAMPASAGSGGKHPGAKPASAGGRGSRPKPMPEVGEASNFAQGTGLIDVNRLK